ncbi:MAG: type II toxin-antitoxin system RelE/ParE family toxin [Defluviitaleaceae bacterium]|nr:type II toxin-antitoxin system RelE/ParE family toxin [Defluviitaleaceae bacterium]MCL2262364.1 type II toxin-antitoxin system RelE/ParE family toxin [Defluviitaleaceae bacterium]
MQTYNVQFLQEALDDLEELVLYIAKDSKSSALKMHDEVMRKAEDLSVFPNRGRPVPDEKMKAAGYRMLLIKPYIAFYRVIGKNVFIYRVIHGATNYPMLFDKLI